MLKSKIQDALNNIDKSLLVTKEYENLSLINEFSFYTGSAFFYKDNKIQIADARKVYSSEEELNPKTKFELQIKKKNLYS